VFCHPWKNPLLNIAPHWKISFWHPWLCHILFSYHTFLCNAKQSTLVPNHATPAFVWQRFALCRVSLILLPELWLLLKLTVVSDRASLSVYIRGSRWQSFASCLISLQAFDRATASIKSPSTPQPVCQAFLPADLNCELQCRWFCWGLLSTTGVSNTRPAKPFWAARDAFRENWNNQYLSYLVYPPVFKIARPASEQAPSNERRDR